MALGPRRVPRGAERCPIWRLGAGGCFKFYHSGDQVGAAHPHDPAVQRQRRDGPRNGVEGCRPQDRPFCTSVKPSNGTRAPGVISRSLSQLEQFLNYVG